jgi:hypothetical protein
VRTGHLLNLFGITPWARFSVCLRVTKNSVTFTIVASRQFFAPQWHVTHVSGV